MASSLEKRLAKLEEILHAKLSGPPYCHLLREDDESEETVRERLVAEGKITSTQKLILIEGWRWRHAHGYLPQPEKKPLDDPALGAVPVRDDRTQEEKIAGAPPYKDIIPLREEKEPKLYMGRLRYPPGSSPY